MIASLVVAAMCTVAVAAVTIWFADAGVPSETAVPVIVVALLALRSAARRSTTY
jgi:hypothetical protein